MAATSLVGGEMLLWDRHPGKGQHLGMHLADLERDPPYICKVGNLKKKASPR